MKVCLGWVKDIYRAHIDRLRESSSSHLAIQRVHDRDCREMTWIWTFDEGVRCRLGIWSSVARSQGEASSRGQITNRYELYPEIPPGRRYHIRTGDHTHGYPSACVSKGIFNRGRLTMRKRPFLQYPYPKIPLLASQPTS